MVPPTRVASGLRKWARWPWVLPEQSWLPGELWPGAQDTLLKHKRLFACKQLKSLWEQALAPRLCVPLCRPVHHADPGLPARRRRGFWGPLPAWPMPCGLLPPRLAHWAQGLLQQPPTDPWPGRAGPSSIDGQGLAHNLEGRCRAHSL